MFDFLSTPGLARFNSKFKLAIYKHLKYIFWSRVVTVICERSRSPLADVAACFAKLRASLKPEDYVK